MFNQKIPYLEENDIVKYINLEKRNERWGLSSNGAFITLMLEIRQ